MTEERQLRAGRDYPLWPYLKWGHAVRHSNALAHDYTMWRASLGAETRAEFSGDRRVVTFHAALATSPPSHEWSLAFGDAIHNYRSALDALAWAMANLDGNRPEPQYEKQIYFPMKKSREAFAKEAGSKLSSIPGFVLERMAKVQPYHVEAGQKIEDGIALILHDLDIADKHKAVVEAQAVAVDKTWYSMTYRPVDFDGWVETPENSSSEWIAPDRPVQDGDPILRCTFPAPVQEAEILELPLQLAVRHGGKDHDVFELLQMIENQVSQTFAVVETGRFRPE